MAISRKPISTTAHTRLVATPSRFEWGIQSLTEIAEDLKSPDITETAVPMTPSQAPYTRPISQAFFNWRLSQSSRKADAMLTKACSIWNDGNISFIMLPCVTR